MKIFDLLQMCTQNLYRRRFRTLLTVIGVVIGTSAIISMISLGIGINQSTNEMIATWGDLSMIDVFGGSSQTTKLNDDTLTNISKMDYVDAVTPFVQTYDAGIYDGALVAGKGERYTMNIWNLCGVYPEALESLGYKIGEGRMLQKDGGKFLELVVGSEVVYQLEDTKRKPPKNTVSPYPNEHGVVEDPYITPLNSIVTIKIPYGSDDDNNRKFLTYDAKIVGVLAGGESDSWEVRSNVYMDSAALQKIGKDYKKASKSAERRTENEYGRARIRVTKLEEVGNVQKIVEDMGFFVDSMEGYRQKMMAETQKMQIILGGLGGVSLLVAAISIANTMVMSVYERTREIGIMKVLGCFIKDIRTMFLVEAAIIGFIGGLLGVGLSYLISYILNRFGGDLSSTLGGMGSMMEEGSPVSVIPMWLNLVGMAFATTVGVIAGFYPASRAVKISALEAIKQD